MNRYIAIMRAADHIERNPGDFNFLEWKTPPQCGSPGCALGWIGFFAGHEGTAHTVAQFLGFPAKQRADMVFYRRVDDLLGVEVDTGWRSWHWSASLCAKGLRLYAEKYHGDEKSTFATDLLATLDTIVPEKEIA